ncbi:MAG: FAD-binding oxidoreductase [Candidatus Krumholzibacteria bacterium]|nr:FAD-binding oxidoreductase [Candidatus Krumholzibacteria bacterium]
MTDLTPDAKRALCATVRHWRDSDLDEFAVVERGRRGEIALLLEPETEAELAALIEVLRAHRIPTATVAGQTGLVEAQRPHGVAISMKRFDWIGELTLADGASFEPAEFATIRVRYTPEQLRGARLRVGAGAAIDTINEALAVAGLKLPIVMGSTATASAGACAANGSAGANAVRYGTAADLARRVRGVLGTGEVVAQDVPGRKRPRDAQTCAIRADRFAHGASLVGSQGALGLITEVVYEVFPVPRDQAIALLPVADIATATHLMQQLRSRFDRIGRAVELFEVIRQDTLDRALVHAEQSLREGVGRAPYYAMALVVSDTTTPASAFGSVFVEEVVTFLMNEATAGDGRVLYGQGDFDFDHDPARLIRVREACSEMSRTLPKQAYDVVVPLAQLDGFVSALEAKLAARFPAFRLGLFGHAGVGALHLHAIAPDAATLEPARDALDALVFDLVQDHGGSPWAEHGVGAKWGQEWQRRTPPAVQAEMLRLKRQCDPDNVIGSRLFGFDVLLAARPA